MIDPKAPAFPIVGIQYSQDQKHYRPAVPGMDIRTYAAIEFIKALLSNTFVSEQLSKVEMGAEKDRIIYAMVGIAQADAFFAALNKEAK